MPFLPLYERLELAWLNFMETDRKARWMTMHLTQIGGFKSASDAFEDFYFVNNKAIDALSVPPTFNVYSDVASKEPLLEMRRIMKDYLIKWESKCMFKYLPAVLRKDYDDFFMTESRPAFNLAPSQLWKHFISLSPGVAVAGILSLRKSLFRASSPFITTLDLPFIFRITRRRMHFRNSGPVFLDVRAGCAVESLISDLQLIPSIRAAATSAGFDFKSIHIATSQSQFWENYGKLPGVTFPRLPYFSHHKGDFIFGDWIIGSRGLKFFNSADLSHPFYFSSDMHMCEIRNGVIRGFPGPSFRIGYSHLYNLIFGERIKMSQLYLLDRDSFNLKIGDDIVAEMVPRKFGVSFHDELDDYVSLYSLDTWNPTVVILNVSQLRVDREFRKQCMSRRLWGSRRETFVNQVDAICQGNTTMISELMGTTNPPTDDISKLFRAFDFATLILF